MKKSIISTLFLVFCVSIASCASGDTFSESIDIPGKYDKPLIYQRKNYAISFRIDSYSPSDSVANLNSSPGTGSNVEICFKTSETVDHMIRIGTQARRLVTAFPYDATYDVLKVGWGARVYMLEWGEIGGSYGLFNMYTLVGIDTYSAAIRSYTSPTPPPDNITGGGFTFGGGIELVFSPITSFMLEAAFQRTWLSKSSVELPLEGFVISAGIKVDLI